MSDAPTRSWKTFAVPAAVSALLSAATVGSLPYWQDSAFYLVAVKEFSVLYAPGFVVYLSLCKAWTILLSPFADFTLSVHLFSSLCAALAAGFLALAAERWTGDRIASLIVAVLAAAGFTWWFSGLYAKGYSLYYLIVAAMLWRMACGDPLRAAVLLGLSWNAHPSAALLGPAFGVYLWQVRDRLREQKPVRLAAAAGAAVLAAIGPCLFLPWIAARESPYALGDPRTLRDVFGYILGTRYTTISGVWGFDAGRWLNVGRFFWEEFLGVGLILLAAGLPRLVRERQDLAAIFGAWILVVVVVSTLFKIEGQNDLWLVAAWMPLWIAAAFGLSALRRRAAWAPVAAAAGGLLWAVAANGKDLYLRNYELPELYARAHLQHLDPNATLVVYSDDACGLTQYLQRVRGFRSDVRVLVASHLSAGRPEAWYLRSLAKRWPELPPPDFDGVLPFASRYTDLALTQAAIVNARPPGSAPVYLDAEPAHALLRSGGAIPAGFLWRWSPAPAEPDPRAWELPVTLEQVAARRGRRRGQKLRFGGGRLAVAPEPYEWRLIGLLAEARRAQAGLVQRGGTPQAFADSARLYASILDQVPEYDRDPEILYPLGVSLFMIDRVVPAAEAFQRCLREELSPAMKAGTLFYLGEIEQARGQGAAARELWKKALEVVPFDSPLREQLEKRLR